MLYRILADLVVSTHLLFIVFVLLGGILALWQRWWPLIHVPAALWGALIEFRGWICPLTPLENRLRAAAGLQGYEGGFVEHYLMPVIYPPSLTHDVQYMLGGITVAVNVGIYVFVLRHWSRKRSIAAPRN